MLSIHDNEGGRPTQAETLAWLDGIESQLNEYCTTNHDLYVLAKLRQLVEDYFFT